MKKSLILAFLVMASSALAKDIVVNTPQSTLLLKANEGQPLKISYYGSPIDGNVNQVYYAFSMWEDAYPTFGTGNLNMSALAVRHADGNMSTDLVVTGSETKDGLHTIHMKDRLYDLLVDVCYQTFPGCDVIETWTRITNNEKKPIVLEKYASGFLPIRQTGVWIMHQHGSWGDEAGLTREPLTPGVKTIQTLAATRSGRYDRAEIMFSLDGKPQENTGRAIGAALCWSGNYRLSVETNNKSIHRFLAGINEDQSHYTLQRGQSLETPHLAISYSTQGVGGVSRSFHRWARNNNMVHNGNELRKILLNSWEGVYMNVSQPGMEQMMDGLKELGGELFVMDDGWFGRKYRRTNDSNALGDWETDTVKLPRGIPALVSAAKERGLEFGIWIEPEMVNTKSELYEKHPDWVVCHPTRKPITDRGGTQLTLDMSNPKVQEHVFQIVDRLMTENPQLFYIKWDCNMDILNFGSSYLTADRQSHLYVDYQYGLINTLKRIRAKYPNLVIQACGSGGGRVNYGVMPYFEEFWVSDNTDAQQRIFMQWGTSLFYPSCAMAQHVSASPNHQTGRRIPLKFRFDVAMTGRLGMEMKPSDLNPQEKEFVRKGFALYKELRPLIQQGNLYRIINPYDQEGFASQMFVSDDRKQAVFFAYKFQNYVNQYIPRFRFDGLDPGATYTLHEVNCWGRANGHWEGKTFTGSFLMTEGIELNMGGDFASHVIRVTAD